MSENNFNPNSIDTMLSKLLTKDEERAKQLDMLSKQIKEGFEELDGRIGALERDKWYQRGVVATLAVAASSLWEYVKKHV